MGAVLTKDSTITCGKVVPETPPTPTPPPTPPPPPAHGGTVTTKFGAKLTVNNSPVRLASESRSYEIDKCKTPATSTTSPCLKVTGVVKGASNKLFVGTVPVLLDTVDGQGTTTGNPKGTIVANAGQSALTATGE